MLRGYWIAAVALGLTLAFTGLATYQILEYQREQAEQRQSATETNARNAGDCFGELQLLSVPICLYQLLQADAESERAEYDLQAQQDMAVWAFAMLWTSLASVFITGIGVVYVARTLSEAKATTAAAIKAANAADETVAETRKIRELETRPWLLFDPAFSDGTIGPEGLISADVIFAMANHGRSPAFNIYFAADISDRPYGADLTGGLRRFCSDILQDSGSYGIAVKPGGEERAEFSLSATSGLFHTSGEGADIRYTAVVYTCLVYTDYSGESVYVSAQSHMVDWDAAEGGSIEFYRSTPLESISFKSGEKIKDHRPSTWVLSLGAFAKKGDH